MLLTQKEKELLELLNQSKNGYTFNELLCQLPSRKDYLNKYLSHLKLAGYNPIKRYYSDGRTRIFFPTSVGQLNSENNCKGIPIVTFSHETEFKALVISDLHLGCMLAMPEALDKVYEYATANGIHTILGCGDLLDGEAQRAACPSGKYHLNIQEQIELLLKKYPYDKNILTFAVLGDHEKHSSQVNILNIAHAINTARNDLIISERNCLKLLIRNEDITLKHQKSDHSIKNLEDISSINIFGHSHNYESQIVCPQRIPLDRKLIITAPTLSKLRKYGGVSCPTMLELNLHFDHMYIRSAVVKELELKNNAVNFELLSELAFTFPKKNTENVTMHNVEYYRPEHTKKIVKK